ncbi:MAG: rhomboid family intramembrane serine protease [Rhizobiaceae bacterium]
MFIPLHDANYLRHIRVQYVTLAIIVLNCAIWIFFGNGIFSNLESVRATFFSWGMIPAVANGYEVLPAQYQTLPEYSKYLTYAFLHGDFMHLAGNMLFIWVFGDNVEDAMGHFRFAIFFALSAIAGAYLHSIVQPESESPLIGASGAAAGIITAYLMLHPKVKVWVLALGRIPLRISAVWVIGAWILFQLANFAVAGDDQISWAAHVGGIVAGAVLLPVFKRSDVKMFDQNPVDEVIPPVPPPSVAEEGYPLPGQPAQTESASDTDAGSQAASNDTQGNSPTTRWGRHGGSSS